MEGVCMNNEELRLELEALLPCTVCGANAGIESCTCGNEAIREEIFSLVEKHTERAERRLQQWIEHEAKVTTIQNIEPLKDGQYIRVDELIAALQRKEKP